MFNEILKKNKKQYGYDSMNYDKLLSYNEVGNDPFEFFLMQNNNIKHETKITPIREKKTSQITFSEIKVLKTTDVQKDLTKG